MRKNRLIMITALMVPLLVYLFTTPSIYCKSKSSSVVETVDDAQQVFNESVSILKNKFNIVLYKPISLKMVSREELDTILNNTSKINYTGCHTFQEGKHIIYMIFNVGKDDFFGTLCHEMTHGWQVENGLRQSARLREGTARWVEVNALRAMGYYALANQLNDFTVGETYGVGYRYLQKLEDQYGTDKVLSVVKTLNDVPDNF